jgi:pimeloyl-ACP methyl ester carboxylesterase
MPPDFAQMSGMRVVEATCALLEAVGPAVLVTHSMSGAIGWKVAELVPDLIAAIVAVAPSPPGNIQPRWTWPAYPEKCALNLDPLEVRHFVASPLFPVDAFDAYFQTLVPESARMYNERLNARGLALCVSRVSVVRSVPSLVVSAASDPNHPDGADAFLAEFVGAEHMVLAHHGLDGHGHLMMIEYGNLEIFDLVLDWLERRLRIS